MSAGILRNKERSCYIDKLNYLCYDLLTKDISETEKLRLINTKSEFLTVPYFSGDYPEEIPNMLEDFYTNYIDDNIPIDGIVIKSNLDKSLEKFGSTNHHPNNTFAWKDVGNTAVTKIIDVKWNLGRSKITPVAILEPVELNGSIISKASIHNINIINKLDLCYFDTVEIEKANEIIPQIVKVVKHEKNAVPICKITECPSCHKKLKEENGQLFCTNKYCNDRLIKEIEYLASKEVLNIKGLSNKTAEKIVEAGLVKRGVLSIFSLKTEDFIRLEGFGFKSAKKLNTEIENVLLSNIPLPIFITATAISGIGKDVGIMLSKKYHSLNNIIDACKSKEDFTLLKGIGKETNNTLHSEEFINKLLSLSTWLTPAKYKDDDSIMNNSLTFVITGTLSKSRKYFKELIEESGHKVSNTISKKTDYLLAGHDAGSKLDKAINNNIKIIDEYVLLKILKKG